MTFEHILCTRAGSERQVAVITLNRPRYANAMMPAMARELEAAVHSAVNDNESKAIIISGSGRHFCAGADAQHIRELAEQIAQGRHPREPFDGNLRALHRATVAIFEAPKTIVAAINGSAMAGGLDIALACDYRFASVSAKFGESYVKLGLPPMNGGAWLLPRIIGAARAFRMLATGEVLNAESALAARLVDEVCPDAELHERAVAFAESAGRASAPLVSFIKSELKAGGALQDALARAYVAGVGFSQSEEYKRAIEKLPDERKPAVQSSESSLP